MAAARAGQLATAAAMAARKAVAAARERGAARPAEAPTRTRRRRTASTPWVAAASWGGSGGTFAIAASRLAPIAPAAFCASPRGRGSQEAREHRAPRSRLSPYAAHARRARAWSPSRRCGGAPRCASQHSASSSGAPAPSGSAASGSAREVRPLRNCACWSSAAASPCAERLMPKKEFMSGGRRQPAGRARGGRGSQWTFSFSSFSTGSPSHRRHAQREPK